MVEHVHLGYFLKIPHLGVSTDQPCPLHLLHVHWGVGTGDHSQGDPRVVGLTLSEKRLNYFSPPQGHSITVLPTAWREADAP